VKQAEKENDMKRSGLSFYVEGEYVRENDWEEFDDPADQDWIPFDNTYIHPFMQPYFTAWSQFSNLTDDDCEELTNIVITVIGWLYQELDWRGFCATLWLYRGKEQKPKQVFKWELC